MLCFSESPKIPKSPNKLIILGMGILKDMVSLWPMVTMMEILVQFASDFAIKDL